MIETGSYNTIENSLHPLPATEEWDRTKLHAKAVAGALTAPVGLKVWFKLRLINIQMY